MQNDINQSCVKDECQRRWWFPDGATFNLSTVLHVTRNVPELPFLNYVAHVTLSEAPPASHLSTVSSLFSKSQHLCFKNQIVESWCLLGLRFDAKPDMILWLKLRCLNLVRWLAGRDTVAPSGLGQFVSEMQDTTLQTLPPSFLNLVNHQCQWSSFHFRDMLVITYTQKSSTEVR